MASTDHYTQERELHTRAATILAAELPDVRVLDVELDLPHETVRLFVDRDTGVDHELCRNVTRIVRDMCPQYSLEVSSPGIEPPIRTVEHLLEAVGSRVRVRVRGARRSFVGILLEAGDHGIAVEREDGTRHEFAHEDIARMHRLGDSGSLGGFEHRENGVRSQT
jgi:ribosome maturation factor RimP